MKKVIIFLGPPGSGKGTQAKILAAKHEFFHISTGTLIRAIAKKEHPTEEEKQTLDNINHGKMATDDFIYRLVFEKMDALLNEGKKIALDGAVRTVAQAGEYQKFFSARNLQNDMLAIEVAIPDDESLYRMTHRKICGNCGNIVTVHKTDPQLICEKCGGNLIDRKDDTPEFINLRISQQGNKAIEPIREFYRQLGILKIVDGTKIIEEVTKEIEEAIGYVVKV